LYCLLLWLEPQVHDSYRQQLLATFAVVVTALFWHAQLVLYSMLWSCDACLLVLCGAENHHATGGAD
jgi:lysophospholipid acyltransferase (LPLAT)-like uncharacterized protein